MERIFAQSLHCCSRISPGLENFAFKLCSKWFSSSRSTCVGIFSIPRDFITISLSSATIAIYAFLKRATHNRKSAKSWIIFKYTSSLSFFIKNTTSSISVFHRWSFARATCSCGVKLSEIFNSLQSGWQTELAGRWAQMTTNERRENVAASRRLLSGRSFYQSLKWSPSQSQWRQRTTSTGWGG